jgi:hypothetical protein
VNIAGWFGSRELKEADCNFGAWAATEEEISVSEARPFGGWEAYPEEHVTTIRSQEVIEDHAFGAWELPDLGR